MSLRFEGKEGQKEKKNCCLWEQQIEMTWPPAALRTGPGQTEVPHSLPCVWSIRFPMFCTGSRFRVNSLWRVRYCWDSLDWICEWTQLRPLCQFVRSNRGVQGSQHLAPAQDKLIYNYSCFLNLPAPYLEWSAALFGHSLASQDQFQITPRKHPRLWTNSI